MHTLLTSFMLARLILAWFVLTLGVAVASPIVHPQAMEIVCSAGDSMKVVLVGDDGDPVEIGQHTLDCSLCLAATLPLAHPRVALGNPQPLAHALEPIVAARIAALVGAPLPPRGPPRLA
jgi:hypothetical protein